jgi:hypothetical protein
MRRGRQIKNPCSVCGKPTDSQGWCGASDHDDGNPWGGIACLFVLPPKPKKQDGDSIEEEAQK